MVTNFLFLFLVTSISYSSYFHCILSLLPQNKMTQQQIIIFSLSFKTEIKYRYGYKLYDK